MTPTPSDAQLPLAARLAELIKLENPEFRAWVEMLPDTHWAKYDLSACRLGWEAARLMVPSVAPKASDAQPVAWRLITDWTADRDDLGRKVREAWIKWAETQPSPKPSWLVPYDALSEPDKEADRQIGEALTKELYKLADGLEKWGDEQASCLDAERRKREAAERDLAAALDWPGGEAMYEMVEELRSAAKLEAEGPKQDLFEDAAAILLSTASRLSAAEASLAKANARIAELEAAEIIAPSECDPNCDDPNCPYNHTPLTLRQAYENAVARLREAEMGRSGLQARIAELVGGEPSNATLDAVAAELQKSWGVGVENPKPKPIGWRNNWREIARPVARAALANIEKERDDA